MNKLQLTLAGVLASVAALPAIAGPDVLQLRLSDHARNVKLDRAARMEKVSIEQRCASRVLVLPLDHGPRAQTTPYQNELRKERFDAEMRACRDSAR